MAICARLIVPNRQWMLTCRNTSRCGRLAVPAEFENFHPWDFSKFGRGERFVDKPLPREEFDEVFAQVERWGLDQYLRDRSPETLSY